MGSTGPDETLAVSERTLARDPRDTRVWIAKAEALVRLKRYEHVLAACAQALAIAPRNARAWVDKS